MNFICRILIVLFILISPLRAAGPPLNVGIESFSPPFVMQGANKEIYGFDIDMMNYVCETINRTCQYRVMKFDELLTAVANKQIDVATSSITITSERSQIVDFTIPYLLSYSRFLTNQNAIANQKFSLDLLKGKRIGIETGTIFVDQIRDMGIKDPIISYYPQDEALLEALRDGKVDYVLLDNPTALYWEANSSGSFRVIGQPYMYGYGFGIAVNSTEKPLLQQINQALLKFQGSKEFTDVYNRYLEEF
jgi:polar amino acid transport system substrate-binding protein